MDDERIRAVSVGDLVVADTTGEEAYVPKLQAAGYVLRVREPGV